MESQPQDRAAEAATWHQRVERASHEGDEEKLLELAEELTEHFAERLRSQSKRSEKEAA
jgi:hypothetical protein